MVFKEITRLPAFFPLKVKICDDPATAFFSCLDNQSLMENVESKDVLNNCSGLLNEYKSCMEKHFKKKKKKGWLW